MYVVRSQNAVAGFFGVNRADVRRWLAQNCPGREGRRYDLSKITAWRAERVRAAGGRRRSRDLVEAETRRVVADARTRVAKRDQLAGVFVSTEAVRRGNDARAEFARALVGGLVDAMVGAIVASRNGQTVPAMVTAVRRARKQWAERLTGGQVAR